MKLETENRTPLIMRDIYEALVGKIVIVQTSNPHLIRGKLLEWNGYIISINNKADMMCGVDGITYIHYENIVAITEWLDNGN